VAAINLYVFSGVHALSDAEKVDIYRSIYQMALCIPVISVAGVLSAMWLRRRDAQRLRVQGRSSAEIEALLSGRVETTQPNWWILGGSAAFVAFTLAMGFSKMPYNQQIIFAGSFGIISFLLLRLFRELEPDSRAT